MWMCRGLPVVFLSSAVVLCWGYATKSCKKKCDLHCSTERDLEYDCFSRCKKGTCTMNCEMDGECYQHCRDRAACSNIQCRASECFQECLGTCSALQCTSQNCSQWCSEPGNCDIMACSSVNNCRQASLSDVQQTCDAALCLQDCEKGGCKQKCSGAICMQKCLEKGCPQTCSSLDCKQKCVGEKCQLIGKANSTQQGCSGTCEMLSEPHEEGEFRAEANSSSSVQDCSGTHCLAICRTRICNMTCNATETCDLRCQEASVCSMECHSASCQSDCGYAERCKIIEEIIPKATAEAFSAVSTQKPLLVITLLLPCLSVALL